MSQVRASTSVVYHNFIGINNVTNPKSLKSSELQEATNVTLTNDYLLQTRKTLHLVGSNLHKHSAYFPEDDNVYIGLGTTLAQFNLKSLQYRKLADISGGTISYCNVGEVSLACTQAENIWIHNVLNRVVTYDSATFPNHRIALPTIRNPFVFKGRLYGIRSGRSTELVYSDALAYMMCDTRNMRIGFPFDMSQAVPTDGGIYVLSDKLYYLRGSNPNDFELKEISTIGGYSNSLIAVPSTLFDWAKLRLRVPIGDVALWWDADGLHLGLPDGEVFHLTKVTYRITDNIKQCCVAKINGYDQVCFLHQDGITITVYNPWVNGVTTHTYPSFQITSLVTHPSTGTLCCTATSGFYTLTGNQSVDSTIKFCKVDTHDIGQTKHVLYEAYMDMVKESGNYNLNIITDTNQVFEYVFNNDRVKFGKNIKTRYFELVLKGNGLPFELMRMNVKTQPFALRRY